MPSQNPQHIVDTTSLEIAANGKNNIHPCAAALSEYVDAEETGHAMQVVLVPGHRKHLHIGVQLY